MLPLSVVNHQSTIMANVMDHFIYHSGVYHAEKVAIPAIAKEVRTPFYCYSTATVKRHYTVFDTAFKELSHTICYAVKANSHPHILKTLAQLNSGADVVSGGEIELAIKAGIPADKIVFSGVGKTREEMALALEHGIWQFNVESEPELRALSETATSKSMTACIALRVNPDVRGDTHHKISTGQKESKFGIPMAQARELYSSARALPGIEVQGVSIHIGSQLTDLAPFKEAFRRVCQFVEELRNDGHEISTLDLGGGLGIPYENQDTPQPEEYAAAVKIITKDLDCHLIFEPGRLIVGNAGILVTRVLYVKQGAERTFVIVDAGMNDLLRPSMYDAYHAILPVAEPADTDTMQAVDIVGPVCENADIFAEQRHLALPKEGDLLAIRTAGAYGAVMASTYNARPLVQEVIVDGDKWETT